jgi:DNA polymerase III subunit epsilon
MSFIAIDFETATGKRDSACAVGMVIVENSKIIEEYHSLIQPPNNEYSGYNIKVHGITEMDTMNAPFFSDIFPEIRDRLEGRTIVAHNESFDRSVLQKTMDYYGLAYSDLNIPDQWECTLKIYRAKGYHPASLDACCKKQGIKLHHHQALSDARGCAMLYLKQNL